jgi:hypothetical protein
MFLKHLPSRFVVMGSAPAMVAMPGKHLHKALLVDLCKYMLQLAPGAGQLQLRGVAPKRSVCKGDERQLPMCGVAATEKPGLEETILTACQARESRQRSGVFLNQGDLFPECDGRLLALGPVLAKFLLELWDSL